MSLQLYLLLCEDIRDERKELKVDNKALYDNDYMVISMVIQWDNEWTLINVNTFLFF